MLRVLVFVTLIAWGHATGDGGFARFCREFLEGDVVNERTCEKEFKFHQVPGESAEAICQFWSRFDVISAKVEKNKLNCIWNMTGNCDANHYIRGYCYKLDSACSDGWKPLPLVERVAFRWVALTYDADVVMLELPKKYQEPSVSYADSQLLPLGDGEKPKDMGVILGRMPVFGGYPGDIVYLPNVIDEYGQQQRLPEFVCRKKAAGELNLGLTGWGSLRGGQADAAKHGSGAFGNRIIESNDGSFFLKMTRNVYAPKLESNGEVDLNYFHDVCETFCEDCFVATPDYLDSAKLKTSVGNVKFWLPGSRNPISGTTDCSKAARDPPDQLNEWKMLHHKKHGKSATLETAYWAAGVPNKRCSDQGRYAMAYHNGKVVDVPIFDRLPLVCVQAAKPPPIPKSVSHCYKNSEPNGNGGCKCKAGFEDVLGPTFDKDQSVMRSYIQQFNLKPGYVCLRDPCTPDQRTEQTNLEAILFVIDGSGSIYPHHFAEMKQFLEDAGNWLPRHVLIYMLQYGQKTKTTWYGWPYDENYFWHGWAEKDWSRSSYDGAVRHVMRQIGGVTPTYWAIDLTRDWYNDHAGKNRPALMIVITDGKASDSRGDKIEWVRRHNIDIKYVAVGHFDTSGMIQDVKDPAKDIILMDNYYVLREQLKTKIINFMSCTCIKTTEVDDAMQPAYE